MAGHQWFRHYSDSHHNPKLRELPEPTQLFYFWLLEAHAANRYEGRSSDEIAWLLHVKRARAERDLERLKTAGLLLSDGAIKGWDARQYKSDNSTERSRKHRAQRGAQRSGNAACNGSESETESDKNIRSTYDEKEKRPKTQKRRKARPMSEGQEDFINNLLGDLGFSLAQVIQDLNMRPPKNGDLLSTPQASKVISHLKALADKTPEAPAQKTIKEQYAEIGIPYSGPEQEN